MRHLDSRALQTYITVVGMRFVEPRHYFSMEDDITFLPVSHNIHDPNAVEVIVGGRKVAHVSHEDTQFIRELIFSNRSINLFTLENYANSTKLWFTY